MVQSTNEEKDVECTPVRNVSSNKITRKHLFLLFLILQNPADISGKYIQEYQQRKAGTLPLGALSLWHPLAKRKEKAKSTLRHASNLTEIHTI